MVDLDLRQAITTIVQNKSNNELNEMIENSVNGDEQALPGLGVVFEMIWQESSKPEQNKLVDTLYNHLHSNGSRPQ
ncbi:small acid-soluble spore protein SspI [Paenibacillus thailandensis]|uniref:Small, acid-soluble spore protein I n=1 Tax=Paenibacillus thailandensis TaxID=393250 RepID=A0ABW5R385_9BACL